LSSGEHGWQETRWSGTHEHYGRSWWRFLERFEKCTFGLLTEPLGIIDNEEALFAFARTKEYFSSNITRLADLDEIPVGSDGHNIAVRPFVNAMARRTLIATIIAELCAICCLCKRQRELSFSNAFRACEEVCGAKPVPLGNPFQNSLVAIVSNKRREGHIESWQL